MNTSILSIPDQCRNSSKWAPGVLLPETLLSAAAEIDRLTAMLETAYQAGRDSMKAEAVKVCEKWHDSLASEPEMLEIAEEIRSLK